MNAVIRTTNKGNITYITSQIDFSSTNEVLLYDRRTSESIRFKISQLATVYSVTNLYTHDTEEDVFVEPNELVKSFAVTEDTSNKEKTEGYRTTEGIIKDIFGTKYLYTKIFYYASGHYIARIVKLDLEYTIHVQDTISGDNKTLIRKKSEFINLFADKLNTSTRIFKTLGTESKKYSTFEEFILCNPNETVLRLVILD